MPRIVSHEAKKWVSSRCFAVDYVVDHVFDRRDGGTEKMAGIRESSQTDFGSGKLAIFVSPHGLPLKRLADKIQATLLVSTNQVVDGERFHVEYQVAGSMVGRL
jgi:hypothetical protein